MATQKQKSQISFEQCLDRLSQISDMLSANEISLEDALTVYEEGTALIKRCNTLIENAEKRISLVNTKSNSLSEEDDNDK